MTIACVVPTIRPAQFEAFREAWLPLFAQHQVELITVWDGDEPLVDHLLERGGVRHQATAAYVLGPDADLIFNRSDVVRNLGFAYIAAHMPEVTHILTLDDDCYPRGDTIADHLAELDSRVPISWMSSSPDAYTRGFPYGVRDEAPVMVSHGVWYGNADWDARTQLANSNAPLDSFYRGPIPKGALFPFCGMNVMFKREALPLMYFAPMGLKVQWDGQIWDRFGDIWLGITLKRALDRRNWAMVSGYAAVEHTRASDVHVNLKKEATGLEWNEQWWQAGNGVHPYFARYAELRGRWADVIAQLQEPVHA